MLPTALDDLFTTKNRIDTMHAVAVLVYNFLQPLLISRATGYLVGTPQIR